MRRRVLGAIVCLGLLAGCATSGPTFENVYPTLPKLKAHEGRVFVYRSSIAGPQPLVLLDGAIIGGSKALGFYFVDCEPGEHVIRVIEGLQRELRFTLAAGEERFVRISSWLMFVLSGPSYFTPELVSREKAVPELKGMRYAPLE